MKLTNHEIRILVALFKVMEPEMTYEHEDEVTELAQCSVGELHKLAEKLEKTTKANK